MCQPLNRAKLRADYKLIKDEMMVEIFQRQQLLDTAQEEHNRYFSKKSAQKLDYWTKRLAASHKALEALQSLGEALRTVLQAEEEVKQPSLFE